MTTDGRFSPPVAHLRAVAATRPSSAILPEAETLLTNAGDAASADLCALLILTGNALTSRGDVNEAVRRHTRAHDIAVDIRDRDLEAEAACGIGSSLQGADDHSSALQHFERAERIVLETGNARLRAGLLRRMGASFSMLGRHRQAMDSLQDAAVALEPLEDVAVDRIHLAHSTVNARSREVDELPRGDPGRVPRSKALAPEYLQLAEDARNAGLEHLEIMALGNYAICARRADEQDEAIRVLRALIPRYEARAMRPNVVLSWNHLGFAHEEIGDWREARNSFEQALKLLENGGSSRERSDAFEGVARACEALGDAWGALAALKAARAADPTREDEAARLLASEREHRAELARLTERWERVAEQDPLTGLNNRRALETWLEPGSRDLHTVFSLLLVDLDDFKGINDAFGHGVGDRVLVEVGHLLRTGCRQQDIPVRFGGDEFVIALPGAEDAEAQAIAERIRAGIAGHAWETIAAGLTVTASVGCASSMVGGDATAVFAQADRRVYEAKRAGRNRVNATAETAEKNQ